MSKQKKKMKWYSKLLIILLSIVIAFLAFSYGAIRFFTGDSLSFKGVLAMAGYGGFDLPQWYQKLVMGGKREYDGLPYILTMSDGTKVTTESQFTDRRAEILSLYEEYMYGHTPAEGFSVSFALDREEPDLQGKAIRREITATVTTSKGSKDFPILAYIPANSDDFGVFVGLSFTPTADTVKAVSEGSDNTWCTEMLIDNNIGLIISLYTDWAKDEMDTYRDGLLSLFDDDTTTAYSAWGFAVSRLVDYAYTLDGINTNQIASAGHSRLARVSTWAGACDERIKLVTQSSGGGLLRSPVMGKICRDGSSEHWFTEKYFEYIGRDEELPVDVNLLYALMAGRHYYISTGDSDLAADPRSMYECLLDAQKAWADIYGMEVLDENDYFDLEINNSYQSESVGFHIHKGGHKLDEDDWKYYIDYFNKYLK